MPTPPLPIALRRPLPYHPRAVRVQVVPPLDADGCWTATAYLASRHYVTARSGDRATALRHVRWDARHLIQDVRAAQPQSARAL